MMRPYPGFIGGTAQASSVVGNAERTINWYTETMADGAGKNSKILVPCSGLSVIATWPYGGPVYGVYASATRVRTFALVPSAVAGTPELVEFATYTPGAGTFTLRGTLWGITGLQPSTPVWILENPTQLLIVTAMGGYVFDLGTNTLTQLTASGAAAGWPTGTLTGAAFLDGYFVVSTATTLSVSAINDGTNWNALAIATGNDGPNIITGLCAFQRQLWVFGSRFIAVYDDAGTAPFPFQRIPGAIVQIGTMNTKTIVPTSEGILFCGAESGAASIHVSVFKTNGYAAQRISNFAVDALLEASAGAFQAYLLGERGHTFYYLQPGPASSPAVSSPVYDLTTGDWHERQSYVGGTYQQYLGNCFTLYGGLGILGSWADGTFYGNTPNSGYEGTNAILRTRIAPHLAAASTRIVHSAVALDADAATGPGNTFTLSASNDGGKTFPLSWTNQTYNQLNPATAAARTVWRRLGSSRDRVYKLTTTSGAYLVNAYIDITEGRA